jgi:hypothetical protein
MGSERMKRKPKARYSWNRKHDKCNGSGWVTVMGTSRLGGRPMVAVERCSCWYKISPEPRPKKKLSGHDGKARGAGE